MNGLTDGRFYRLRRLRRSHVDLNPAGMLLLQVRPVDGRPNLCAQVLVPDVADHADNGGVELDIVPPPSAIKRPIAFCGDP